MIITPAIDLIEGKCVRLTEGNYGSKKIYNHDPLEVAYEFEGSGLRRLHLVDLDGAKADRPYNLKVLERIATRTGLVIDFGGGIKNEVQLREVFNAGAAMAGVGSAAIKEPEQFKTWIDQYGGDKILLGADVRDRKLAVSGWLEQTNIELTVFLEGAIRDGVKKAVITDIGRDGKLEGPSFELYRDIAGQFNDLYVIASGGVSGIGDLERLDDHGIGEVIVGKALYEGWINLKDLAPWITR